MNRIDAIFDRMDVWRHLPSYQLERRADLFFALYLPEVLNTMPQFTVHQQFNTWKTHSMTSNRLNCCERLKYCTDLGDAHATMRFLNPGP